VRWPTTGPGWCRTCRCSIGSHTPREDQPGLHLAEVLRGGDRHDCVGLLAAPHNRRAGRDLEPFDYERRGLLEQPPRADSGYRQYSSSDLWRLQFIRRAKELGFTLAEIAEMIGSGDRSPATVLATTRAKIGAVEARQRDLEKVRCRLAQLAELGEGGDAADCVALKIS
jgi:DNA-binding transcriptional MerR regulator